MKIPIEISARHIHLCQKDLEKLFGKGYQLKKLKNLTQPGNFAAKETVVIKSKTKEIKNVRIVGPLRQKAQVELSLTDSLHLGIEPKIRKSGCLRGTPVITLIGPKGKVSLEEGVIVPWRHVHFAKKEAQELGLKEDQLVSVRIKGKRGIVFENVLIRVGDNFKTCMHLDTDEGNAAGITKRGRGEMLYC